MQMRADTRWQSAAKREAVPVSCVLLYASLNHFPPVFVFFPLFGCITAALRAARPAGLPI